MKKAIVFLGIIGLALAITYTLRNSFSEFFDKQIKGAHSIGTFIWQIPYNKPLMLSDRLAMEALEPALKSQSLNPAEWDPSPSVNGSYLRRNAIKTNEGILYLTNRFSTSKLFMRCELVPTGQVLIVNISRGK